MPQTTATIATTVTDDTSPAGKDVSDFQVSAVEVDRRVRIVFNGVAIADSRKAILYKESRLPPVYYFPRGDVSTDLLRQTRHLTHCPFKGNASYWTLTVGDRTVENAVWSYENAIEETAAIKGYLAFYLDRLGVTYDEEGDFTAETAGHDSHGNAYVDWLVREGWNSNDAHDLTQSFADMLLRNGAPLSRLSVFIRTLHPLLIGNGYVWRREKVGIDSFVLTHDTLDSPLFLDSPLVPIFNGAGGIRRRLEGDNPLLDYGILRELHGKGVTDYVAMPMNFSDGQINAVTLASDRVGGFTTADLGRIHEVLPVISRFYEVHAVRNMGSSLLQTYLGRQTGERVLKGKIKRGDSEELHAVIWFCDLRQSTVLAESMPRDEFLAILNRFFECMVQPVVERGGEVLRFIGDAVLAIFPLAEGDSHSQPACEDALAAAAEAQARMADFNVDRAGQGKPPLGYGIGLHLGDVTYGNIGIPERLEFTVIGAAANEAARIEDLTKTLEPMVLVSEAFAGQCQNRLVSQGRHKLRGVGAEQEIFAPFLIDGR